MRVVMSMSIMLAAGGLWLGAQVRDFRPVTETMLRNPAAGDWLNWRRTDNGWGYSPLDQINRQNVQQMQLAWSWAMDDTGAQQATPLVYDGVMYLPNPRGVIQALDAATGDLIWEYRPAGRPAPTTGSGEAGRGIQRNIAIFGDKIFGTTNDAHIVAVDARTGKLVWETQVADSKLGYGYTSGPIVVRGKVMAGMTGCTRYKKDVCFISAHDAATGKEVWRTSTIARPGEPGGDTWGDLPLEFRAGSDAWIPGSYDPATNLVYWGTAQAKPWAQAVRGTDGAALYTNSTLALDPDTGKMRWYFQHVPAETLDMDEVFERVLIDTGGRQSVFTMGKLGILWQLDRATGAFIRATDIGYQNILDVDQKNRQDHLPPRQGPADRCRARLLPQHRRLQELARDGVQPADRHAVRPDQLELRDRHVRSHGEDAGRRRRGSGEAEEHEAPEVRRQPRRVPRAGRTLREDHVAAPHALAVQHGGAHDRRQPRVRRRLG